MLLNVKLLEKAERQLMKRKVRALAYSKLNNAYKLEALEPYISRGTNKNSRLYHAMRSMERTILRTNISGITPTNKSVLIFTEQGEARRYFSNILNKKFKVGKKSPITNDEHLGIEIECFLPLEKFETHGGDCDGECFPDDDFNESFHDYINSELTASDILTMSDRERDRLESNYREGYEWECDCENSDHFESVRSSLNDARIEGIDIASDGSIDAESGYFGIEIKVLTKANNMANLEKLCKWLNDNGAKVNKSCGLHVHLDVRNYDDQVRRLMVERFANSLNILTMMVPKSRLSSNYCKIGASYSDRYHAVNATAIDKFSTVEIRLHSGTVNFTKISEWCQLLQAIKHNDMLTAYKPRKLGTFLDKFTLTELSSKTRAYMLERIKQFSPSELLENELDQEVTQEQEQSEVA